MGSLHALLYHTPTREQTDLQMLSQINQETTTSQPVSPDLLNMMDHDGWTLAHILASTGQKVGLSSSPVSFIFFIPYLLFACSPVEGFTKPSWIQVRWQPIETCILNLRHIFQWNVSKLVVMTVLWNDYLFLHLFNCCCTCGESAFAPICKICCRLYFIRYRVRVAIWLQTSVWFRVGARNYASVGNFQWEVRLLQPYM